MPQGLVIKSTGKWYHVLLSDSSTEVKARIRGKFRLQNLKLTNPIGVGDLVEMEAEPNDEAFSIVNILPRKNYVVRESPRRKHHLHLIASNIDLAVLIVTVVNPTLKPGFIDRFLLTTEPHNIPAIIVVNKCDLWKDDDWETFEAVKAIYERIGYQVMATSAEDQTGIEELKLALKDQVSLVSGHSGVGKSTLINVLEPNLELRTNVISDYSGKGMHTTTFAELFNLSFGGSIIDTPGIKQLGFINLEPMDVAHNFREFFEVLSECKFPNCMHLSEPSCAVKAAIDEGKISGSRYMSYERVIQEIQDKNYWERFKDM